MSIKVEFNLSSGTTEDFPTDWKCGEAVLTSSRGYPNLKRVAIKVNYEYLLLEQGGMTLGGSMNNITENNIFIRRLDPSESVTIFGGRR